MQLQGVVTTGIYCRADCTARPDATNVRPVRNAVEALASGFRPCLLCRPDRLPGLGLLQPVAEVAHALRLIADGFLDNSSTEELATRIGYSSRQLVRLFEQHVGASPDFVARAQRAHLARRLLDESELSITDVAFAAGFASLRQMNRVMRQMFAFAPSELRAKRTRGEPLQPLDGGLRLRIPFDGPLAVQPLMAYLGARAIPGVEAVRERCYRRTVNTCGFPGVAEVRPAAQRGHLEATMHLATFGSIIDQVRGARALFGLDVDTAQARRRLRRCPHLGPLVRRDPGLRVLGAWDRFETAVRIIVGQQVTVTGASTILGRIVARFGEQVRLPLPEGLGYLFPTPRRLADTKLENFGMPKSRARALQAFAAAVASGDIDLTRVAMLPDTIAALRRVRGIGPWTANLIAARVMGHLDAFPSSDLGLRRAGADLLNREEALSTSALETMAEAWRPFRALAAMYLWMNLLPRKGPR